MQRDQVKSHGLTGQLVTPDWPTPNNLDALDRLFLRFTQAQKPPVFSSTARAPSRRPAS
jgi:hypothetical protein